MPKFLRCALGVFVVCLAAAQTASKSRIIGAITSVDAGKKQLVVKADDGSSTSVQLDDATKLLRVAPGEKDLTKATPIQPSDLAVGDRVLVRGGTPAISVLVMTKTDLAKKHELDRAEWQKRGMAGLVTAVNRDTKEITISTRVAEGRKTVVVDTSGPVNFRRYARDSVRFADAKPSKLEELQNGDQLRVLGDKNADGTRVKAEEIVFGTFLTLAGTINGVDAAASEITLKDLDTKKLVVVRVNADTSLKKLPPMLANVLAMRLRGEQPGMPRPAGAPSAGPGGPGMSGNRFGGPRGNMDFSDMLERMPAFNLAELKAGDALILSSTRGADPSKVTAITMVYGVEPLLTAAPERQIGGMWNFDIPMPAM
ncbi:MAG: DUF5666 domain-containing protein [Bryobacteraceae bacterium]